MWPFTSKTLKDRYSKLIKLIMSIDSHCLRIFLLFLMLIQIDLLFAQRYTGFGRGLSDDFFDFGFPGIGETITLLIVAVISLSIAGFLVKVNENKEGRLSNVIITLTLVFGILGFGAALPLVYHYWYVLLVLALGIALYGAYKDRKS